MDSYSKIPKKKRFSQHKPNGLSYKVSFSLKKNDFSFNDKSNSVNKNKKIRLQTDYADHEYTSTHGNRQGIFAYFKPSSTKKGMTQGFSSMKKKQSFAKDENKSQNKIIKNVGVNQFAIYSTKHDSKKNHELKSLFGLNPYESKIKNNKKVKQNHNMSMFLNLSKQKKKAQLPNDYLSPYNQPINKFLKQAVQKHNKSRYPNQSVSRQKRQISIKQRQKRSINKYQNTPTPKHVQLNLIDKNNIRLKTSMGHQQQEKQQHRDRNKSINKQSKINNFFSNKGNNSQHQNSKKQHANYQTQKNNPNHNTNNDFSLRTSKQQQQSTVKTIKKQENNFNPKQSSLRQMESSRVPSLSSQASQDYGLTDQEIQTFGDRFPYGFQKIKLLGRGGFSLVWLGKHIKSGKQFAIKQIISNNTHQTHIKEIWFGTMFFTLGGVPKPQFSSFTGIKNLVRLYSYEINQIDTWIFYQKCGKSLGTSLYDIKSQKIYGEQKLYKIHYKPFYLAMQKNPKILTNLIIQICKSIALVSECEVVHSDLKTENILIKFDQNNNYNITEVKLIDYGSSFQFRNISQFSMATPEYMPPEILNYIIHENQGQYEPQLYEQVMKNYQNPWAVDMWSLGCVFLQIVVGVPLWMSLPLLVPNKVGKSFLQKQGLFAVKGRLFPQIIAKQRQVVGKINSVIQKQNYSKIVLSSKMKKCLKGMLQIDFNKRISPTQVIQILSSQI